MTRDKALSEHNQKRTPVQNPASRKSRRARMRTVPDRTRLSYAEREVLRLCAEGFSGIALAKQRGVTPNTIRDHRRNILRKLNMHSMNEAARYWARLELALRAVREHRLQIDDFGAREDR